MSGDYRDRGPAEGRRPGRRRGRSAADAVSHPNPGQDPDLDGYPARQPYPPPDPYAEPDPYRAPPRRDSYPGPRDSYPQPRRDSYPAPGPSYSGPYSQPGSYPGREAYPDPYPGRDAAAGPEHYARRDQGAETDPYARTDPQADQYRQADPYRQPGGYDQAHSYGQPDGYGQAGVYDQPGGSGPPDAYGPDSRYRGAGQPDQRDPYAGDPYQDGSARAPAEPYRWLPPSAITGPGPAGDPDGWPESAQRPGWPEASMEQPGWADQPREQPGWADQPMERPGWPEASMEQPGWADQPREQPGWADQSIEQPGWADQPMEQPGWRAAPVAARERDWRQDRDEDSRGFLPGFGGRDRDSGRGPRPRRRRFRWAAPLIALIVIVGGLAGGGIYVYRIYSARHANYQGSGYGSVMVQVLPGEGAVELAPALVKLGVIAAADPFSAAAEASKSSAGLEPGYFRLHKHMNAALAYRMLISPTARIQTAVTIPEGLREVNIIRVLGAKSPLGQKAFASAVKQTSELGLPSYAGGKPEGYLFPDTYTIAPHETALQVLQAMVAAFKQTATSTNLVAMAKKDDFTPAQIVVEASLIQAEGRRLQDFPKIARVIDNRLNLGMKLQLDSTVLYALGKYGIQATDQQLQVNSPYNTYLHTGLPSGPIDSPGAAAINAALHPAAKVGPAATWIYFVTVNPSTGLTKFTDSSAEFAVLQNELRQYEASHPKG